MSDWKETVATSFGSVLVALGGALVFARGLFEKLAEKSGAILALGTRIETERDALKASLASAEERFNSALAAQKLEFKKELEKIHEKHIALAKSDEEQETKIEKLKGNVDLLTQADWEQDKEKMQSIHKSELKLVEHEGRIKALEDRRD